MELFCRKFSLTHSPPQVEVMVKRSVSYPGPCKPLGFLHRNSLRQRLLPGLLRAKKHGKRFPSGKWNSADDVSLRSLGADPSRKLGRVGERDFSPRIAFKKTRRPLSDSATGSPGSTGVTKMGLVANETHEREKSAPPETKPGKNAERSELSTFGIFSKDNGKRKRRESKFVQTQPLYQAYWMEYKEHGDGDAAAVVSMASAVSLACLFQSVKDGRPRPTCPRNDTASLWQELCEVKERGIPDQIDANQLLLQEVIFEVVTSEASYQRSLSVAVCHFQKSRKLSECLVSTAKHTLFSNLPQVRDVSERFLLDLEDCLEKDVFLREIGNLILQHCPDFRRVYVPYVTNQMYQEKLMQQLVRENARFLQVLHKLEEQSVCNRQPLKSFLVLPFQRITRLKILLENILKLAWDRPELANSVRNALAAVSQIVSGCNEGVRSMMQTEQLVMLEKKVDFVNIKSVPLISRGRVLLQHGELTQTMVQEGGIGNRSRLSNKPIHLHVFSDLLLLSNKTEHGRFLVIDYASRGHVQADSLTVKALGLPNSTFLLRLCRNHAGTSHELVLKASNEEEKRTWISVITSNE